MMDQVCFGQVNHVQRVQRRGYLRALLFVKIVSKFFGKLLTLDIRYNFSIQASIFFSLIRIRITFIQLKLAALKEFKVGTFQLCSLYPAPKTFQLFGWVKAVSAQKSWKVFTLYPSLSSLIMSKNMRQLGCIVFSPIKG